MYIFSVFFFMSSFGVWLMVLSYRIWPPGKLLYCMPHREGGLDQRGSQTQLMRGMGLWEALALKIRALL